MGCRAERDAVDQRKEMRKIIRGFRHSVIFQRTTVINLMNELVTGALVMFSLSVLEMLEVFGVCLQCTQHDTSSDPLACTVCRHHQCIDVAAQNSDSG